MLKIFLIALLPFLVFFTNGWESSPTEFAAPAESVDTGTLEKMIVESGSAVIDLEVDRLNGSTSKRQRVTNLQFEIEPDSFFTILVFNGELRGSLPGTMGIEPAKGATLPARLQASYENLHVESTSWGGRYDLVIRDRESGFVFFDLEGYETEFDPNGRVLSIRDGRILISREFAAELGRPGDEGSVVGKFNVTAVMRPIEVTEIVNGEVKSETLPAMAPAPGTVPGPDVIVGDLSGLAQFGSSSGTQVGLAVGTDSCNFGTVDLNWFANPANDHPVIPQNLYRMSGGGTNDERFEQIGQSHVKHAFTALTNNICNLGCNGVGGSRLGSGCSDPYSASLNSGPNLGSKAWINPYTGFYPRNDSATPNNSHTGHTHTGPSHRILTEIVDLSTSNNPGATYYAEGHYVTPHEYAHCQANPGQCNMHNNVSYRRYNVTGTTSPFSFSPAAATVRTKPAIEAWTGASIVMIEPAPGTDGRAFIAYKVTNPSTGVWHYEYAIYNMNLDRAIQMLSIPIGAGVTVSNVGFHAPPQHPGWPADGTLNNAGFSNLPWTGTQTGGNLVWASETFAQNQNANAIRWSTLYNFRFDSNRPPQALNATIGFFKTGSPMVVQIQGPSGPTASVTVSGRVSTSGNTGITNARVTITGPNNFSASTVTSSFGTYSFGGVIPGGMYTITVRAGKYSFTPQVIQVNDNVSDVNFQAAPNFW